jgi:hypothetical protein
MDPLSLFQQMLRPAEIKLEEELNKNPYFPFTMISSNGT